jgi:phosphate transport system substrate-binding protein
MIDRGFPGFGLIGRLMCIAGVTMLLDGASGTQAEPARMPEYVPQSFVISPDARYRESDGAIAVVGYNDMNHLLQRFNEVFTEAHPGIRFDLRLRGTATAAPALAYEVSAFAPMGAEFSQLELAAYHALTGREPLQIRVAHCSLDPAARSAPLAIFVNRSNPLRNLTVAQVRRVFATGDAGGDLTRWGQLVAPADWSQREIHPVGIAEERTAGLADYMLSSVTNGLPFTPRFEGLYQSSEVVRRVGEDRTAIGFAAANAETASVRILAIADTADDAYYLPSVDDVINDRYPLNRHLYIYVNRSATGEIDPLVTEYLRLVLSQEGQAIIKHAMPGYLPLNAKEVIEQLEKIS